MGHVNAALGGFWPLKRALAPFTNKPLSILDVGSGDGSLGRRLLRWGAEKWRVVGIDLHPEILSIASQETLSRKNPSQQELRRGTPDQWTPEVRGLSFIRGDGRQLPFANGSFDVVVSSLTLHHFSDEGAVKVLEEMKRVSRRIVLVSDLERHPFNLLGALVLSRTIWAKNPLARWDGPASVRRAFTREELRGLAMKSGFTEATIQRHFFFRLILKSEFNP